LVQRPRLLRPLQQNDPRFRDGLCLVARAGGRIVSTVQIFDRTVNLGGEQVPMGGIGSVDHRQRGIVSALIRLAVTTMDREGFEVSLLFADRIDFYARFGWHAVARHFTALVGAENSAVEKD
jgi:predicted acetyltransferase